MAEERRGRTLLSSGAALVLCFTGFALFSRGFFPVKPLLPGYSTPYHGVGGDHVESANEDASAPTLAPFSRLVFVVIDALRSDFAFGPESSMDFVSRRALPILPACHVLTFSDGSLVSAGRASPYTALASPPTVTLPRLKALTTGSNPTFLDAILNIAEDSSSPVLENVDSWVRQLAVGTSSPTVPAKKIVFAGDDTWLRLFPPSWFSWSEGVTSFFVSDTKTVDTNVTRHLDRLLSQGSPLDDTDPFCSSAPSDWDVLILHYLGLDHVGHLGGPNSPLMAPKQTEMDDVVQRLYFGLLDRDAADGGRSLLVVVGDHGMTDMGNHGGSSEAETAAALLIVAPSDEPPATFPSPPISASPFELHEVVKQIDLVPTLSVLLGLGIPRNSMGRIITSAVERYGAKDAVAASLRQNVDQIKEVLEAASKGAVEELVCSSIQHRTQECSSAELVTAEELSSFLNLAQERLMTTFGDCHLWPMVGGLALLATGAAGFAWLSFAAFAKECAGTRAWVGAAFLAYLATFFATSFIEEEHEFWYFVTVTILVLSAARPDLKWNERLGFLVSGAGVRVMRAWPHNGQKAFANSSVSSHLVNCNTALAILAGTTYVAFAWSTYDILARAARRSSRNRPPIGKLFARALAFAILLVFSLLYISLLAASLLQQLGSDDFLSSKVLATLAVLDLGGPVQLARAGYAVGAVTWSIAGIFQPLDPDSAKDLDNLKHSIVSLFLLSLTRPANVPLFLILGIQYRALATANRVLSPLHFSTLIISLQHSSFFAFGGSNSLATIDLSQAYNGISSYQVHTVALLTFLSNFAGPVFWSLASSTLLPTYPSIPNTPTRTSHLLYTSTFHAFSLFTLALSATHFRRHLFTWTVFSPALLYKGAWSVLVHFGSDTVLSFLLQ